MRYFELTQDRQLRNLIAIDGFQNCPDIVMDRARADSFKRCTNMYVKGDEKSQYPDLFKSPVLMISEKLYQILKYYDTSVIYKIVVLTDLEHRRQEIYRSRGAAQAASRRQTNFLFTRMSEWSRIYGRTESPPDCHGGSRREHSFAWQHWYLLRGDNARKMGIRERRRCRWLKIMLYRR